MVVLWVSYERGTPVVMETFGKPSEAEADLPGGEASGAAAHTPAQSPKVDGFVPQTQSVNFRIVRQADDAHTCVAVRPPLWSFRSKVDGFVPRTQSVNFRIVRQSGEASQAAALTPAQDLLFTVPRPLPSEEATPSNGLRTLT